MTSSCHGPRRSFDADGRLLRLVAEAERIRLAHLFDPYLAVHASRIEPLPHQITAVYGEMLPRQPLRFLLADDPGAGKTIMAGLLIKELLIRGDLERCLVVAPGSLVEQWQDELDLKFGLPFDLLTRDRIETAPTGNPFEEPDRLIARLDMLSRNEGLMRLLGAAKEWDLVVCDEAHRMAASFFGTEVKYTKRYRLGELLGTRCRHFLLMTATPHNGKEEDFQLFMALLEDRELVRHRLGAAEVDRIREEMERAEARRLQPHYIESFFLQAFRHLGGSLHRREAGRYGTEGPSTSVGEVEAPRRADATQGVPDGVLAAAPRSGLRPRREVARPHPDVAAGRYRQAEFAADLSQVVRGRAEAEYQDPVEFFARTYLTEGMRRLMIQALLRITGQGGEPVIQLKTAFGGGKTHSLLALYHLLRGRAPLDRLQGAPELLGDAGIEQPPPARVAVVVGTAINPTRERRPPNLRGITIRTLWGEIAAQLAEQAGDPKLYDRIRAADRKGVPPGSDALRALFNACGPCLILIDELVAYARRAAPDGVGDP